MVDTHLYICVRIYLCVSAHNGVNVADLLQMKCERRCRLCTEDDEDAVHVNTIKLFGHNKAERTTFK